MRGKTMGNPHDLVVGQTVFLLHGYSKKDDIKEIKISKIGRKYFYLEKDNYNIPYDLETLEDTHETNYKNKIYLKVVDYIREMEEYTLRSNIYRLVTNNYKFEKLSFSQLKKIDNIIKEDEKTSEDIKKKQKEIAEDAFIAGQDFTKSKYNSFEDWYEENIIKGMQ
jgi:hypothetical protein